MMVKGISEDALNTLLKYSFPGNAGELENIIERAISFTNSPEILLNDLPSYLLQSLSKKRASPTKFKESIAEYEKELIWAALQESRGNISKAADFLGIHRQQLQRKIKLLKIAI